MSWRTNAAALILALSAILNAAGAMLDADPSTNPNWDLLLAQVGGAWGFLHAKDKQVTGA